MKPMIALLSLFLITSCGIFVDTKIIIKGNTTKEIQESIYNQVFKVRDIETGYIEYWQTPEETLLIGRGDCDDIAILFMYEIKNRFGTDSQLIIAGSLFDGFHCYVKISNEYYDPTNNGVYFGIINIIEILGYEETMYNAENYHTIPLSGFLDGRYE